MNQIHAWKQKQRTETIPRKELGNHLRILEIGCGDGIFGSYLKQRLGKSCELYVGYDVVNMLSDKATLDYYYCDPDNKVITDIIEKHNINCCAIVCTFHHITQDKIIKDILLLLKQHKVKLLLSEELVDARYPKLTKAILIANDLISNLRQYGIKLPKLSTYFALNFKQKSERRELLQQAGYEVAAYQQARRYGYVLTGSFLCQAL